MPDFESRNLDDAESLARLAELLHPTKVARTEAKARGRRRAAAASCPSGDPFKRVNRYRRCRTPEPGRPSRNDPGVPPTRPAA